MSVPQTPRKRRRLFLPLILTIAITLGGCRSAREAVLRIVVIPKGLTHEFWQSIHRGAQRAARDLAAKGINVEIIFDGPLTESDSLAQIRIVDRRISSGVDGIVLAPQHSRTMVAPVERAHEHGIPVVIIDSGLHALANSYYAKYVATDNENGGYLAAKHLVRVLRERDGIAQPRLILFRYQVGSESTEKRERGFERYIEEEEAAGRLKVQWLSKDRYAGATRDSAKSEASPLLQRLRGQIDGIFAPNESSANGMLDALRSLNMNQKVRLVGFDSSEPLLKAVEAGDIEGLILQDPYRMGYLGVWTLAHDIKGYDVRGNLPLAPAEVIAGARTAPLGMLGLQSLLPDVQGLDRRHTDPKILSTGEHVITLENLHSLSTRELFDPQLQEKRTMIQPLYLSKQP